MKFAWLAFPILLVACKDPALNADNERVPSRSAEEQPGAGSPAPAPVPTPAPVPPAPKPARAKANAIQWDDKISWASSWEEGSKLAREGNKPIFLLVYADWCPHCRNLKAVFADDEVRQLAGRMVMIRQDADDEGASWLSAKVGAYGGYVPRIFFLSPDGTVRPEITSQNQKFPYFYTPEGIALLKASMKKALGG